MINQGQRQDLEQQPLAHRYTILGLFEDSIDAERALQAVRRESLKAEQTSILLLDQGPDEAPHDGARLSRSVSANALDAVGGWLRGLASIVLPDNGRLLVAGPIGAVIIGHGGAGNALGAPADQSGLSATVLGALKEFGFADEEADYLEHRVKEGDTIVGLTTGDPAEATAIRNLFASVDAVYIGQTRTVADVASEADTLLATPAESNSASDVLIVDSVAPLVRAATVKDEYPGLALIIGSPVSDDDGVELGEIDDVLCEAEVLEGSEPVIRYFVIGRGGLLGIGRHRTAVPAGYVDITAKIPQVRIDRGQFQAAPSFDSDSPFSRREEAAVHAYFSAPPYWETPLPGGEGQPGSADNQADFLD